MAFVAAPILVEPADRNLDFGVVERGEGATTGGGLGPRSSPACRDPRWAIRPLPTEAFRCRVSPGAGPGARRPCACSCSPDAIAGPFREILRLATDDPRMPVLDFTLSGTVIGDLYTSPGRLNFRFVRPGQALSKEIGGQRHVGGTWPSG